MQDPADAIFPAMPESALQEVRADYTAPVENIAAILVEVVSTPVADRPQLTVPTHLDVEV